VDSSEVLGHALVVHHDGLLLGVLARGVGGTG